MTTIKDIEQKILDKIEQKFKGGNLKSRLGRIFSDQDKDQDGFLTFVEFMKALVDGAGNPISQQEAEFLFNFWDTLGGQEPAQGAIQWSLAVQDLLQTSPVYGTGFNSGDEFLKANKGGRGNKPSQARAHTARTTPYCPPCHIPIPPDDRLRPARCWRG